MGVQNNRFNEMVLLSTQNICLKFFMGKIILTILHSQFLFIWTYEFMIASELDFFFYFLCLPIKQNA